MTLWNRYLIDLTSSGIYDLSSLIQLICDPFVCFSLSLFKNQGSNIEPEWEKVFLDHPAIYWGPSNFYPHYQWIHFDEDEVFDIALISSDKYLAVFKGIKDSVLINFEEIPYKIGWINYKWPFMPIFHDYNRDGYSDLILVYHGFSQEPRYVTKISSLSNDEGRFDINNPLNNWFKFEHYKNWEYFFNRKLYIQLLDFDSDGDRDIVCSYGVLDWTWNLSTSRVIYFENVGNDSSQEWKENNIVFSRFDLSDSLFTVPVLLDMDGDGALELMIKRDSLFVSYKYTGDSLMWVSNPSLLKGIEHADLTNSYAVAADMNLDGRNDLVFLTEDKTLICYYQIETTSDGTRWWKNEGVFRGMKGSIPAFTDFDGDGDLDMVIFDDAGFLNFYYNRTPLAFRDMPENSLLPDEFTIRSFPNPFNTATNVNFYLPLDTQVRLSVYNLMGEEVRVIFDGFMDSGNHNFKWNGQNMRGELLASGIYFIVLRMDNNTGVSKVILLK